LEGVSLVRRNRWTGEEERIPVPSSEQRGLLSSLVEFLFGPTISSGPSEADRWRLRSAVILEKASTNNGNQPISLQELAPFADDPPSSFDETFRVITQGLIVVAYFNGVPSSKTTSENESTNDLSTFDFPELTAEGQISVRYDDPLIWERHTSNDAGNRGLNLFYSNNDSSSIPSTARQRVPPGTPKFLYEQAKSFSSLSRNQFFHCLLITLLNFIGVVWFAQSLEPGGILADTLGGFGSSLKKWLIPILWFYARLFLVIPFARLVYILASNKLRQQRNEKRENLARILGKNLAVVGT